MVDKKDIKKRIEDYEYNHSGISYVMGSYAEAINIRVNNRDKKATADVKLVKQMDGITERYNDCEYTFAILGVE